MAQPSSASDAKIIPIAPQAPEDTLYEVRRKIYPRAVSGIFERVRSFFHRR